MAMSKLEVSARMTIRNGKLEEFKRQAAECIKQTRDKDTKTLRYDWFLSSDQTECEIREIYESSEGLVEHRMHIGEALDKLFTEFADDHAVSVYGQPSPQLVEMAKRMPKGSVKWYSFLQGLE
jgi:quinol monooxygenase YgiN